jgi:hypothetical protein
MAVGERSSGPGPGFTATPGQGQHRNPRARRWLRNLAILAGAAISLAGIAFGALWILTPSVSNAPQLVGDMARDHNAVYPGPPVPYRTDSPPPSRPPRITVSAPSPALTRFPSCGSPRTG